MKIQLHIKSTGTEFAVCYKSDVDGWRQLSPSLTHDKAVEMANKIINFYPDGYLKTICDCKTNI